MQALDLIDITNAPRSFIDALAENQPAVTHEPCEGHGCDGCLQLGFEYVMVMT